VRYLKMLGLAIIATAAMTVLVGAGPAHATVLCQTNTTPCGERYVVGQEVAMNLVPGTEINFHEGFAETRCGESTIGGLIANAGSSTEAVAVPLETLSFGSCTARWRVLKAGSLEFNYREPMSASAISRGMELEWEQAGISCVYGSPAGITIGQLTGGKPALLTENAELSKIAGGFLCANPAHWEAQYVVTSPNPLFVAES